MARDIIHNAVKNALINDGWVITADPYTIKYEEAELFADLSAERPIVAERGQQKIIVEIKSFITPSPMQDLANALGQYEIYAALLALTTPNYELYLAISERIYQSFFQQKATQAILARVQPALLVVDITEEKIVTWIK